MPYVKQESRELVRPVIDAFEKLDVTNLTEGDMDYIITRLITRWIKTRPRGICFANLGTAVGILHCAILELNRRILGPYERWKVIENGDVPVYDEFPDE